MELLVELLVGLLVGLVVVALRDALPVLPVRPMSISRVEAKSAAEFAENSADIDGIVDLYMKVE